MTGIWKRLLCVLLAACMLLPVLSGEVLAAESGEGDAPPVVEEDTAAAEVTEYTEEAEEIPAVLEEAAEEKDVEVLAANEVAYPVTGGSIYFNTATGTVTDCDYRVTEAVIPSEIGGVAVTSIGFNAFWGCYSLASVTIPGSVTSIGENAFFQCSTLTSITIPSSVASIGESAFLGCSSLTSIDVVSGNSVFSSVEGVLFNAGKTSLLTYPEGKSGSYCIPDSVRSIGEEAFHNCFGLTGVTIPGSVASLEEYAFCGCSGLTSVTILNSSISIGSYAFSGCSSLTSAGPIGGGYDYEFSWTKSIPDNAFHGCSGLRSVAIPANATSIGDHAFDDCSTLTGITIPGSITSIGAYAFSRCSSLTGMTLPNGIASIGQGAFSGCSDLASVTIPNRFASIGYDAFYGCSKLTSAGPVGGGYAYEFGWTESIPDYAFDGCSGLRSVTIPASATSIGEDAFEDCSSLTSITIPSGITSIGQGAFKDCSSLASMTLPSGITSIEWGTFKNCSSLKRVTIPQSVTSISSEVFAGCNSLVSAGPIGGGYDYEFGWTGSIPDYAFGRCSGLKSVTIPASVTSIGDSAFEYCSSLEHVTIPQSVVIIGGGAFWGCSNLTSITLPNNVISIEWGVFKNCSSLKRVVIPNGAIGIWSGMFENCGSLECVIIPTSVSILDDAFEGCGALTDVYYTGSLEQWQEIQPNRLNERISAGTVRLHCNTPGATDEGLIILPPEDDEPVSLDTDSYYSYPSQRLFRIRGAGSRYPCDAGFEVHVSGQTYTSGWTTCSSTDDVKAAVPSNYSGDITFSRAGYHPNSVPARLAGAYNHVVMTPETVTGVFANTLLASTGSQNYPKFVNLVTGLQGSELSIYEPGLSEPAREREYYVSINWNGHGEGTVWLEQGDRRIDLVNNASQTLAVETTFTAGETVYLRAVAGDGTPLWVKTSIQICTRHNDGVKINLGDSASAEVDTSKKELEILDTDSLEVDFSDISDDLIPIKFEIEGDGSVKGTIGLQLASGSYNEAAYGKIKEACKKLKDPNSSAANVKTAEELSDYLEKNGCYPVMKPHSSFGVKGDVRILGCFSGNLRDGALRITEIEAILVANGSFTYTHNTTVLVMGIPAPVYFKASLAAKLQASFKLVYDELDTSFLHLAYAGKQPVKASAALSLGGGFGPDGLMSLGGKGSGTLTSYFYLPIRKNEIMWTISGSLALEGTLLGISGEWELLKTKEIVFWENGGMTWHNKEDAAQLYDVDFVPDLSSAPMTFTAGSGGAVAQNISGYAAPALLELADGRLLAVWTADVPGRSGLDKNGLYYSVRDAGGVWTAAQLVWDDGTNDSIPALRQADGQTWLTWQNYTEIYQADSLEGVSYDQLAAQIRTAAVKFDPETSAFDTGSAVTWASDEAAPAWYTGGEVRMPSTYEGDAPATTSTIQTFSTPDYQAILYTAGDEDGAANVYGLFNDGYGWGEPLRLTDLSGGDAGGFSAVISQDRVVHILVNKIVRDAAGSYSYADLEFYEITPFTSVDLAVTGADYVHDTLAPDGTLTITAEVTNNSARTVSGLTAEVSGTVTSHQVTLLPGQTKTVYINYTLSGAYPAALTVTVKPGGEEDADLTDNSAACVLQTTDLSLEEVMAEQTEGGVALTAMVVNRGASDIEGCTITYRRDAPDGEILLTQDVGDTLAPGAAVYPSAVTVPLEAGTMVYAEAALKAAGEENLYGNNADQAVVVRRVQDETAIRAEIKSSDGGAAVVQLSSPCEDITAAASVFAAVYNQDGKMLRAAAGTLGKDGTVRFSEQVEAGWSLYLLGENAEPLSGKIIIE